MLERPFHLKVGLELAPAERSRDEQKEKDRRRARKLAEEAWESANVDNLDLAVKIIRRAVDTQPDNPVLWNDQGVLLLRAGHAEGESEIALE